MRSAVGRSPLCGLPVLQDHSHPAGIAAKAPTDPFAGLFPPGATQDTLDHFLGLGDLSGPLTLSDHQPQSGVARHDTARPHLVHLTLFGLQSGEAQGGGDLVSSLFGSKLRSLGASGTRSSGSLGLTHENLLLRLRGETEHPYRVQYFLLFLIVPTICLDPKPGGLAVPSRLLGLASGSVAVPRRRAIHAELTGFHDGGGIPCRTGVNFIPLDPSEGQRAGKGRPLLPLGGGGERSGTRGERAAGHGIVSGVREPNTHIGYNMFLWTRLPKEDCCFPPPAVP